MYQRILLTLDGSVLARAAIRHAAILAADGNAGAGAGPEIIALQVLPSEEMMRARALGEGYEFTGGGAEASAQMAAGQRAAMRREAERELSAATATLKAAGAHSVRAEIVDGLAGQAIVDYVREHDVDAIVMSTRGYSGLGREVMGSVAEYVLRHAGDAAVVMVGPQPRARG